ncbi:MAG: acVLRF1 family peptidyl-tRNA hydrolase [Nocardioidaceae bacterium]
MVVPWVRLPRWTERFAERHPGAVWMIEPESVSVEAPDGARATWAVPFPPLAERTMDGLSSHLAVARDFGVLLVRRGGFAVATARGSELASIKIGRRHVQGRTKAGGWSQQRFARRRANQARQAFDAAADHAAAILAPSSLQLDLLVVGGDRVAVEQVLEHPRLVGLGVVPRQWVQVPADPRRDAVQAALARAQSVDIEIVDPTWE